jgi:hypothetical protein
VDTETLEVECVKFKKYTKELENAESNAKMKVTARMAAKATANVTSGEGAHASLDVLK